MSECKSDCFGIMPDGEPCHYHSVPSCKEQLLLADALAEAVKTYQTMGHSYITNGVALDDALAAYEKVRGLQ